MARLNVKQASEQITASVQGTTGASNCDLAVERYFATHMNFFSLMIRVWLGDCLPDHNLCWHRHFWLSHQAVEGALAAERLKSSVCTR
jgi:hypothetical protein